MTTFYQASGDFALLEKKPGVSGFLVYLWCCPVFLSVCGDVWVLRGGGVDYRFSLSGEGGVYMSI